MIVKDQEVPLFEDAVGQSSSERQVCLLCGAVSFADQRKFYQSLELLALKTKCSGSSMLTILTKIVGSHHQYKSNDAVCSQCYNSLNLLDELHTQAQQLQSHLVLTYRSTRRRQEEPPLACSEAVRSLLSQSQLLQSGVTIDATPSLSLTYTKSPPPKRRRVVARSAEEFLRDANHCCDYLCSHAPVDSSSSNSSYRQWLPPEFPEYIPLSSHTTPSFMRSEHNDCLPTNKSSSACSQDTILKCSVGDLSQSLFASNPSTLFNIRSNLSYSSVNSSSNPNYRLFKQPNSRAKATEIGQDIEQTLPKVVAKFITPSLKSVISSPRRLVNDERLSRLDDSVQVVSISRDVATGHEPDDDDVKSTSDSSCDESSVPAASAAFGGVSAPGSGEAGSLAAEVTQAAMLLSNPEASSLLQSFLTTSLWMATPADGDNNGHVTKDGAAKPHHHTRANSDDEDDDTAVTELSEDVTRESLNAVAATLTRTTRRELKNTGQSYVNTRGKTIEAKHVAPQDCSKCVLRCGAKLSEADRQSIFAEYWGLADYAKQREYLAHHMHREEKLGPSGLTRTVVLYYLTHHTKVQVCRQFFLKTLCVSEKASRIVLEKKMRGDFGAPEPPPPAWFTD
ncbi:uncharacterized protein LOC108676773 [Hyalella azteca]|uniref:Uncharacterized protein LOC108676773 n=1 Tax=Hyalella azteca TaxID=294128 RepID=A0A8B7P2R1_HYAAZ|nr:uncharacterized protein LOC108676773 [Hyalella azteca]